MAATPSLLLDVLPAAVDSFSTTLQTGIRGSARRRLLRPTPIDIDIYFITPTHLDPHLGPPSSPPLVRRQGNAVRLWACPFSSRPIRLRTLSNLMTAPRLSGVAGILPGAGRVQGVLSVQQLACGEMGDCAQRPLIIPTVPPAIRRIGGKSICSSPTPTHRARPPTRPSSELCRDVPT